MRVTRFSSNKPIELYPFDELSVPCEFGILSLLLPYVPDGSHCLHGFVWDILAQTPAGEAVHVLPRTMSCCQYLTRSSEEDSYLRCGETVSMAHGLCHVSEPVALVKIEGLDDMSMEGPLCCRGSSSSC